MQRALTSKRSIFAVVLAAALFASGCGASDSERIRGVFEQSTRALAAGDGEKFCSTLTPAAQESYARQISTATNAADCVTGVKDLLIAVKALAVSDWVNYCDAIGPKAAKTLAAAGPGMNVQKSCVAAAQKINATPEGNKAFVSLRTQLSQSISRLQTGKLGEIRVSGDTAIASLLNARPADGPVRFQRIGGSWKVGQQQPG